MLNELVDEFWEKVDSIYGVYLDGVEGFQDIHDKTKSTFENTARQVEEKAGFKMNPEQIIRGFPRLVKPEEKGKTKALHQVNFHARMERNQPDGNNTIYIGQVCLVSIYQFWNDHYRKKIAKCLGYKTNQLQVNLFGDLKNIRDSIIHNNGLAINRVKNNAVITAFSPNQLIMVSKKYFEHIVDLIKEWVLTFKDEPKQFIKKEIFNLDQAAYRLLYDNIHDFKATAVHVDSEIRRLGIRDNDHHAVPGMDGRTHHDMWVSMKTVSHFNLGIALELMLKFLLIINKIPFPHRHSLTQLYDTLPAKYQRQLESTFQESRSVLASDLELIAFINTAETSPPPTRPPNLEILNLRGLFEYLDKDVILWQKRYSWELVGKNRWRHYLDDISVVVELINRVMRDIPSRRLDS